MFNQLVQFGIYFRYVFGVGPYPSLETCSEDTQNAGQKIIDDIFDSIVTSHELEF